jgi:hypothetical protein
MDGLKRISRMERNKRYKRPKCESRGGKELGRKLRALAARIPDRDALDAFLNAAPTHMREQIAANLVPFVRFAI